MDGFEVNKIVGAILAACVIAMLSGFVAELIFEKDHGEAVAYSLSPREAGVSLVVEAPLSLDLIGPRLADADIGAGKTVAKKCTACHTMGEGGANKIGPNLWDVVERAVASHAGYSFSGALKGKSGEAWSYENLGAFLLKPKDWAPGTKMGFAGIKKPQDRANLILYLRSLSGTPAALPEG